MVLFKFGKTLLFWLVFVGFLAYLAGLIGNKGKKIRCDAEHLGMHHAEEVFLSGNDPITGARLRTEEKAHSGTYSLKLTKAHPYGFQYTIPPLKGNESIEISVWRNTTGDGPKAGVIVGGIKGKYYKDFKKVLETSGDWERIGGRVDPPFSCKGEELSIYCWNNGHNPVYFDDLEIVIKRLN